MKIKYNRVSTHTQTGDRFQLDNDGYDMVLLDKISGSVPFKERPNGKKITDLVEAGGVTSITVAELSRLGRNVSDVISTLTWLDKYEVNVIVTDLGCLQSRPNNEKNKIFELITSVMSSLYSMELANIKERTMTGRMVYVQKGGRLGRPNGSIENDKKFIEKPKVKEIIKSLNRNRTIREIVKITGSSNKTVIKAKKVAEKYGLLNVGA